MVCRTTVEEVSVTVVPVTVDVTLTAGLAVVVTVGASGARLKRRGASLSDFFWNFFFMAVAM